MLYIAANKLLHSRALACKLSRDSYLGPYCSCVHNISKRRVGSPPEVVSSLERGGNIFSSNLCIELWNLKVIYFKLWVVQAILISQCVCKILYCKPLFPYDYAWPLSIYDYPGLQRGPLYIYLTDTSSLQLFRQKLLYLDFF